METTLDEARYYLASNIKNAISKEEMWAPRLAKEAEELIDNFGGEPTTTNQRILEAWEVVKAAAEFEAAGVALCEQRKARLEAVLEGAMAFFERQVAENDLHPLKLAFDLQQSLEPGEYNDQLREPRGVDEAGQDEWRKLRIEYRTVIVERSNWFKQRIDHRKEAERAF